MNFLFKVTALKFSEDRTFLSVKKKFSFHEDRAFLFVNIELFFQWRSSFSFHEDRAFFHEDRAFLSMKIELFFPWRSSFSFRIITIKSLLIISYNVVLKVYFHLISEASESRQMKIFLSSTRKCFIMGRMIKFYVKFSSNIICEILNSFVSSCNSYTAF